MALKTFFFLSWALAGFSPLGPFSTNSKPSGEDMPKGAPSLEVLVSETISALNMRDTLKLSRLAIGREGFLLAYPGFALDTTKARREFSCGYFLTDNRKLMARGLGNQGGHGYGLARFTVEGPVERYGEVTLFRGLHVWVTRDSVETELRFLKSAAKSGETWSIWSFSDD